MYLILLSFILSPFYLWSSGLPQFSHIVATFAFFYRFITKPRLYWEKFWVTGVVFVAYTFFVGLIVFAMYGDLKTILSPCYYAYGFLIFLVVFIFCKEKGKVFLYHVFWIHILILAILTVLSISGFGRQMSGEGRIMVTFNDPNQMANWILWATIVVGVTGKVIYRSWLPGLLTLGLALLAISFTASRSGGIGLFVLLFVYCLMGVSLIMQYFKNINIISIKRQQLFIILSLLIVLVVTIIYFMLNSEYTEYVFSQFDIWLRRFQDRGPYTTLEGRGYDRLWKFPEYLFFGAGEGAHYRYAERTWFLGEIHSSWAGLLFCYGVIGTLLFGGFIYNLLRRIQNKWFKLMLLSPFMFGFATYNIRNWYFWIGLALVYASSQMVIESHN